MRSDRIDEELQAVTPAERAFYVDEFSGTTLVVALADPDEAAVDSLATAAATLVGGAARLLLVLGSDRPDAVDHLRRALLPDPLVLDGPAGPADARPDAAWLAQLWLAVTDHPEVVVRVPAEGVSVAAARLAAALHAFKLVITDPRGGWGDPPRSFADVTSHGSQFAAALATRQDGAVVQAITTALQGGVANVNLCRPEDLDRELFSFDGAGTLFTIRGYVELAELRVDDLPAVERLVGQGVADGILRPRSRHEIARLAVTGLGARVVGSGHLAGIGSLETEPYGDERLGEVACLSTVSRFSGAGAGGLLVDGLVARAAAAQLRAVFAVTVSDAAAAFFGAKGFDEVGQDRVPDTKWAGYDPERRGLVRVLWRDLATA